MEVNIGDVVEFIMDCKPYPHMKYVRAVVRSTCKETGRFIINNGFDCHVCFVDTIYKINDVVIREEYYNYITIFDH